jgi:hypothetical protein
MRIIRSFSLQITLLLLLHFARAPHAVASDDWQYWNEFQFKYSITDDLSLRLKTGQRVRDDFTELFLTNFEVGFLFKLNEHLEFGPLYKFEHQELSSGRRTDENRVSLEGTVKWGLGDFKFANRHRVNYRNFSGDEAWRYRTRLKISRPIDILNFSMKPFVSDEIFYGFVSDRFNENRFDIGLSRALNEHLEPKIYYRLRSRHTGSEWVEFNILGTELAISF